MRLPLFSALSLFIGCTSETGFSDLTGEFAALPSPLAFGEVALGESRTLELLVANGSSVVDLEVEILGADAGVFTVAGPTELVVPPDENVPVLVTFAPEDLGAVTSTLSFRTSDFLNEEPTVPLTGTGRVPFAPDIEIRPATGVDFGAVDVGKSRQGFFEVANVGDAPLVLGSVSQTGGGVFALDHDFSGFVIAPNDAVAVLMTYTPVQPDGDSGAIVIPSNDADEPVVQVPLVANGGGSFEYPVAVIDCPGAVDLAGAIDVVLDGSASFDPLGNPLTYAWSVVRRPNGADDTAAVTPSDAPVGTLSIGAAGVWEVSLTVTSSIGTPSVPAKCVLDAVPLDLIHVELSWSGATSDLDLHLATGDAALYDVPGDVSWCNPAPDWGVLGSALDDPLLALDDDDGFGPEQIGVEVPADGTYPVRVHLFDDAEDGDVTATVSVFTNGSLAWSGSRVLERNEVWDVGLVNWPDATFGVGTVDPTDAGGARECP